jgi:hypothetical protein
MWCWRRLEKISSTDHVRNEEVLLRIKEQRNILHEISKWKANLIGQILRRNCLLQQVIEGKIKGGIEMTERRGRRRRKLLDDLKERRGYSSGGSCRSHYVKSWLWKRLWTCCETDCYMNDPERLRLYSAVKKQKVYQLKCTEQRARGNSEVHSRTVSPLAPRFCRRLIEFGKFLNPTTSKLNIDNRTPFGILNICYTRR